MLDNEENIDKINEANHLEHSRGEFKQYVLERIKICAIEQLKGLSAHQIADKYHKEWDVAYKTVYHNYCTEARKLMKEQILTNAEDLRVDLLAKYQFLYFLFMQDGDKYGAKQVLDSVTKMTQTFKFDLTSNGQEIQTIKLIEVKKDDQSE